VITVLQWCKSRYFQIAAPIIWTTVSIIIYADGRSDSRLSGGSDFPRHWLYNDSGRLAAKAGLADFKVWEKSPFGANTPWHGQDHEALVTTAETVLERTLSEQTMSGKSKPHIARLRPGESITRQGEPGDRLYLILNGVFIVEVDGKKFELARGHNLEEPAGSGCQQSVHVHRPTTLTHFEDQRVGGDEGVRAGVNGRVRKASTWPSRSLAMSLTWDLLSRVMPNCSTSFSIRRVDTPSRYEVATTLTSADSARRRRSSSQSGK
jgi:hypothetical protein